MRKVYKKPIIEVLLFDEEEDVVTASEGYTAAQDVSLQIGDITAGTGKSTSVTTVKIEDIITTTN